MNYLAELKSLKNNYWVLRHGQSEANARLMIASDPERALSHFGLTEFGQGVVLSSVAQSGLGASTIIYSSDFLRAKQTAEIAAKLLGVEQVFYSAKLRERYMGDFEGKSDAFYEEIWREDEKDTASHKNGVESVEDVVDRMTGLVYSLEQKYDGKNILIVSHGDPLQMLAIAFKKGDLANHYRDNNYLQPGELVKLVFKNS